MGKNTYRSIGRPLPGRRNIVVSGKGLAREEVQALLDRLAACGNPSFTPSGKRIMAEFTAEDIRARLG